MFLGNSNSIGLLLHQRDLLSAQQNSTAGLALGTSDLSLLVNFVASSSSLKSGDQHWVPLCLPAFNPGGYLQAFISNITLGAGTMDQTSVTVILIATSSDPDVFKELYYGKRMLEVVRHKYLLHLCVTRLLSFSLNRA